MLVHALKNLQERDTDILLFGLNMPHLQEMRFLKNASITISTIHQTTQTIRQFHLGQIGGVL